ncbi:Gr66a family protein [Megaselia abdita]
MTLKQSTFLASFGQLFFICKIFGLNPQAFGSFGKKIQLIPSGLGKLYVLIITIIVFALYNVLIYAFVDEDKELRAQQSTLTFVIGLFLNYISPVMLVVDQLSAIQNDKKLGEFFNRISKLDYCLAKEGIFINNTIIQNRLFYGLLIIFSFEILIVIATYFMLIDFSQWISVLWFVSMIPSLLSAIDKLWFSNILYGVKQRFEALNEDLESLVAQHTKLKNYKETVEFGSDFNLGYLHKEIFSNKRVSGLTSSDKKSKIKPIEMNDLNLASLNINLKNQSLVSTISGTKVENIVSDLNKLDSKLNTICQLHDELCEIGKSLNELWSLQILALMAYGFLIFTAQLYFFYCSTQNQPIPYLFLSAKNSIITAVFLLYTSWRCVYIIYISWRTSLECKRTGISLHKVGVAADNNDVYEIVNHLSLKLLNHSVDFSACGFFSLDMETLYGVTGGITSYLIILIQFNLAGQQQMEAINKSNWNGTNSDFALTVSTDSSSMISGTGTTGYTNMSTTESTQFF